MHGPVLRPDLGLERGLDRRLLRTLERSEEQGLVKGRDRFPERMELRVQLWEERPLGESSVTYAIFAAALGDLREGSLLPRRPHPRPSRISPQLAHG